MTSKTKRLSSIAAVFAVAVVAAAALSGAAVAATDTLAGDGTDAVTDFNASDSDYVTYTLASDGTDFATDGTDTVYLNITNNDEHVQVSNGSISGTASSYTFNVSQSELGTIPGDAGSNTTVTVNAWGEDTTNDTVNTSVDTFDATLMFHDDYAVVYIGDSAVADNVNGVDAETETDEGGLFSDASASTTIEADNVGLGNTSEGTTVHVVAANTSDEDVFSQAEEAKFGGSYSDSDFIKSHALTIEGHKHAVFLTEAPDNVADDYTYATVGERNGHDTYTVHVSEDYDGESSVDMETRANDGYGLIAYGVKSDAYGTWAVSPLTTTPGVATAP